MGKARIKAVKYNFRQISGEGGADADYDCDVAEIGKEQYGVKDTPIEILEREPTNGLQRHFVDIRYKSGAQKRVFNLCEIDYFRSA